MPGRNIVKVFDDKSYYHIYTRGVNKRAIFVTPEDYHFFLSLFKRYLSNSPTISGYRVKYPWYHSRLDLIAYCLMSNHVHLLIYQEDQAAMTEFMRSVLTSYTLYFNTTHKRVGPLFQSKYRAVKIDNEPYYQHISRYIHLNPQDWLNYPYSSLVHYRSRYSPEWLSREVVLSGYSNIGEYLNFLSLHKNLEQITYFTEK